LLPRLLVLAILFAVETLVVSVWLDNAALISQGGLIGLMGRWGAWTVRGVVGFAAIFLTFAYLKNGDRFADISRQAERISIDRGLLAAHLLAMAAFGILSWALYGNRMAALSADLPAAMWLAAGVSGIALAAFSLIPLTLWVRLVRETGWLWAYAWGAVVTACVVGRYSQSLWMPSARLTFDLVKALLSPVVSGIVADPATMNLGTAKFSVHIAPACSGFEGAGLMLVFEVMWLWLFRRECRFPQALVLIPAGVATVFLLNAARLAGLILIGNAGAQQIALGGFHSQAGWIGFNAVALGFSFAAMRVPWLTTIEEPAPRIGARSDNPTATYLVPFLSVLAVGMVTAAASGGFEWLYPMRFLAAAGALWLLRKRYADLDWRFGWFGPAIGLLAFATWIAIDTFVHATTNDAMPHALADSSTPIRATWVVFRILSAIVTVPIVEELAFRGFLLRRPVSPDFEALPPRTFTWLGLAISSVAFGLLHGNLWFAGVLAGVLYAWALIRRGRIGDAVVAHATTNGLLAGYVLIFHKWHLWL
jgi:exosortase E/protease (VPEID-CTERM system)